MTATGIRTGRRVLGARALELRVQPLELRQREELLFEQTDLGLHAVDVLGLPGHHLVQRALDAVQALAQLGVESREVGPLTLQGCGGRAPDILAHRFHLGLPLVELFPHVAVRLGDIPAERAALELEFAHARLDLLHLDQGRLHGAGLARMPARQGVEGGLHAVDAVSHGGVLGGKRRPVLQHAGMRLPDLCERSGADLASSHAVQQLVEFGARRGEALRLAVGHLAELLLEPGQALGQGGVGRVAGLHVARQLHVDALHPLQRPAVLLRRLVEPRLHGLEALNKGRQLCLEVAAKVPREALVRLLEVADGRSMGLALDDPTAERLQGCLH
mmetsp:Transcript_23675/g.59068  ORF Transcript_23675/g.59068 Transcript_23675/m.59068 type:complete len:331 (-) Transcript_23675:1240-2232(-)